jgi:hypothetical protein
MADIAAGDVTYTEQAGTRQVEGDSRSSVVYLVGFGDGALTYPTGGVPLTKATVGMPNNIEAAIIIDADDGNGFVYKYDYTSDKIRVYQGDYTNTAADAALVELAGGVATPAAAVLYVKFMGW